MPDRRAPRGAGGPRQLAQAMARLRRQTAPPTLLGRVQERWADAVGSPVADEAVPVAERDGIVTVSCRSAVWSAELSMLSESLLEGLNERLGEGRRVRALRFTTTPR
jgi:predicted nucleic acid-binding Zn ribbon protein